MNYDVIGDIHGHASKLEALLVKMGYAISGCGYTAPFGHQVVFVGDLIDGGPEQLRVLEIARAMIESGDALAVLGNHEFNAIAYVTKDDKGQFLREHTEKNRKQHEAFLQAVGEDSALHANWIAWFKTLPIYLDLGGIRVAHAWWDDESVEAIADVYWDESRRVMSESFLRANFQEKSIISVARKILTCGVEWDLPEGIYIDGRGGHKHGEARLAVWRHWAKDLRELALVPKGSEDKVPNIPVPGGIKLVAIEGSPIFIGHHWFTGDPGIETPKLACLDWSAAKNGPLVAYRWDGEDELSDHKFVWAG